MFAIFKSNRITGVGRALLMAAVLAVLLSGSRYHVAEGATPLVNVTVTLLNVHIAENGDFFTSEIHVNTNVAGSVHGPQAKTTPTANNVPDDSTQIFNTVVYAQLQCSPPEQVTVTAVSIVDEDNPPVDPDDKLANLGASFVVPLTGTPITVNMAGGYSATLQATSQAIGLKCGSASVGGVSRVSGVLDTASMPGSAGDGLMVPLYFGLGASLLLVAGGLMWWRYRRVTVPRGTPGRDG
jgi:hypothetical protein